MKLETARLLLRPIEQSDMEQMLSLLKNDVIKQTYMIPDFPSEESAVRLAQRFIDLSQGDERLVVGIALDGRLIGFLNETETLGAVIDALLRSGISAVIAGAFEENRASIRVMEKCGMKRMDRTETIDYRMKWHRCVYYTIEKTEAET